MRALHLFFIFFSFQSFSNWPKYIFNHESIYINGMESTFTYFRKINESFPVITRGQTRSYRNEGSPQIIFQIQIERRQLKDRIEETLHYLSDSRPAGKIKITRIGVNLKPFKNNDLFNFTFGVDLKQREFKFEGSKLIIDYSSNELTMTHTKTRKKIESLYDFKQGFKAFYSFEVSDKSEKKQFWFNCGGCNGDPLEAILYKVSDEKPFIRYYISKVQTESNVASFLNQANQGYFSFFNRSVQSRASLFAIQNNWPYVDF